MQTDIHADVLAWSLEPLDREGLLSVLGVASGRLFVDATLRPEALLRLATAIEEALPRREASPDAPWAPRAALPADGPYAMTLRVACAAVQVNAPHRAMGRAVPWWEVILDDEEYSQVALCFAEGDLARLLHRLRALVLPGGEGGPPPTDGARYLDDLALGRRAGTAARAGSGAGGDLARLAAARLRARDGASPGDEKPGADAPRAPAPGR